VNLVPSVTADGRLRKHIILKTVARDILIDTKATTWETTKERKKRKTKKKWKKKSKKKERERQTNKYTTLHKPPVCQAAAERVSPSARLGRDWPWQTSAVFVAMYTKKPAHTCRQSLVLTGGRKKKGGGRERRATKGVEEKKKI
jgi:hypothetical protein